MSGRSTHALAILGPELHAQLPKTRLLVVGSGGIGCELLKNLVLTGFGHITLLDLDTIDLSNLNRQFLFRKPDVKQPKSVIAARTAGAFNPAVKIVPLHANIKEERFDVAWFQGFDLVLNALDNLDARRHVNKMCMAAGIPLVESGTAGYLGQVQPILKDKTECFDCMPKPTPRTFPVCTIRSTPSLPIHCIVWAKSYLLPQLFGEEEDEGELDEAEKNGENASEIANLRKEAQAFKRIRALLRATENGQYNDEAHAAKLVFDKVFSDDIRNLLSMADMWRSRQPPVPLEYSPIMNEQFVLRGQPQASSSGSRSSTRNSHANGTRPSANGLKDQRTLTLRDNLLLFTSSTDRLAQRLRSGEDTISFDKDDDDTLDFVTAASNLRSAAYDILGKTRWEVKEMAGNIIPAIATTNAVVSGLIVLQALHLLRKSYSSLKNVHLQFKPTVPLGTYETCPPAPGCGVCRDTYAFVRCDPARVTLGELVRGLMGDGEGDDPGTGPRDVSVFEDKRMLSDPDWDENYEKTLQSLGCGRGKFITIVDEDERWGSIAVALGDLPHDHPPEAAPLIIPSPRPIPPPRTRPKTPPPPTPSPPPLSRKRPAPEDGLLERPSAKRKRVNGALNGVAPSPFTSPTKAARLEQDGFVLIEDDDVIVIDD